MAKKILILNGSPRKNGNTSSLTSAFKRGAVESGNEVKEFFIDEMNINGCKSCYRGTKNPYEPCVQKDDMNLIYPEYVDCDVLVLASPLYYWNISSQLKKVFDRFFGVAECFEGLKNPKKDCVLIMAAEGDGFEAAEFWYDKMVGYVGWNNIGKILCPFVEKPGDADGKVEIEKAYNLGKSIK